MNSWSWEHIQQLGLSRSIVFPKYQRSVDEERVIKIKEYILSTANDPTFVLHNLTVNTPSGTDDEYHIVDGQHRIRALISITRDEMKVNGIHRLSVLVDVRQRLTEQQEKTVFKTINKSVPCPDFVLCKSDERKMYYELKELICKKYEYQVSSSRACKVPNMNVDIILEELSRQQIIAELYKNDLISDAKDIMLGITNLNTHVGTLLSSQRGFEIYKRYGARSCASHTPAHFASLIEKVRKKTNGTNMCYLPFVPCQNWVQYLFAHHMYC
jgi:hypothetical protein